MRVWSCWQWRWSWKEGRRGRAHQGAESAVCGWYVPWKTSAAACSFGTGTNQWRSTWTKRHICKTLGSVQYSLVNIVLLYYLSYPISDQIRTPATRAFPILQTFEASGSHSTSIWSKAVVFLINLNLHQCYLQILFKSLYLIPFPLERAYINTTHYKEITRKACTAQQKAIHPRGLAATLHSYTLLLLQLWVFWEIRTRGETSATVPNSAWCLRYICACGVEMLRFLHFIGLLSLFGWNQCKGSFLLKKYSIQKC